MDQSNLASSLVESFSLDNIVPRREAITIANLFIQHFAVIEESQPDPDSFGIVVKQYAVRKEDVRFFEAAKNSAIAIVALSLNSNAAIFSIISAIGSVFAAIKDIYFSSGILTADQVEILTVLKARVPTPSSEGVAAEELLELLRRTKEDRNMDWLNENLSRLAKFPVQSGGNKEFVSQQANRWRSHV